MSNKLKLIIFSLAFTFLLFIFVIVPLTSYQVDPAVISADEFATNYAYFPFVQKIATSFATGVAKQTNETVVTYGFLAVGGILGSVAVLLPFSDRLEIDEE